VKTGLTIQEKLKDLRVSRKLSLEELAAETGISKSALGSYESNDYKDISHTSIITLAKYYGVTPDYLLGLSENEKEGGSEISELKLDDDTVKVLTGGKINNRLLCEIIKHPDFWKFMSDMEIYIDSLAEMQIRNLNAYVSTIRSRIQLKNEVPDSDHYIRTLKASEIEENEYFSRLIGEDITDIAKDIKEKHRKDKETGEENNPLTEVIDVVKEYSEATDPLKATISTLGKQLGMNFSKMDPAEMEFFQTLVAKYSTVYKNTIKSMGRGRRKKQIPN
jgi:transcriptional regulator with XRE-family HTH domain